MYFLYYQIRHIHSVYLVVWKKYTPYIYGHSSKTTKTMEEILGVKNTKRCNNFFSYFKGKCCNKQGNLGVKNNNNDN